MAIVDLACRDWAKWKLRGQLVHADFHAMIRTVKITSKIELIEKFIANFAVLLMVKNYLFSHQPLSCWSAMVCVLQHYWLHCWDETDCH